MILSSVTAAAALYLATQAAAAAGPEPTNSAWKEVPGGPTTSCAQGTPYAFFVHEGSPRRLLVVLNGGGACWSLETCVLHPSFDPFVDATDIPSRWQGIFEVERAENPFHDYTVVDVPYCTGDAHLGRRDAVYTVPADPTGSPAREVRVHHGGGANVRAALDWAFRNVRHPDIVFVLGGSAGAIASPYYAGVIASHYPRARVVQVGESAGGYATPAIPGIMNAWGATEALRDDPAYHDLDASAVTFEDLYVHAARTAPRVRFAQVNSVDDATQLRFLAMVGVQGVALRDLLSHDLAFVRKAVPGLRTFTAPGEAHVLLGSDAFYTLRVDGVSLRDWVADLAAGRSVKDVGTSLLEKH